MIQAIYRVSVAFGGGDGPRIHRMLLDYCRPFGLVMSWLPCGAGQTVVVDCDARGGAESVERVIRAAVRDSGGVLADEPATGGAHG